MPAFNTACVITKVAFVFALVGYIILGAALVMMSGFINSAREGQAIALTMSCGGIYIIGSLFVIGDKLNATAMAVAGVILNLLGAAVWVPTIGSSEPQFAVIGVFLSVLWLVCIVLKYAKTKANRVPGSD
ncbi:MAG: hypothetical protein ACO3JG_08125 [Luteolibacter sp.]